MLKKRKFYDSEKYREGKIKF